MRYVSIRATILLGYPSAYAAYHIGDHCEDSGENLSRHPGSAPGNRNGSASNTARAIARATTLAASAPILDKARSDGSPSGLRPVAAEKTTSPSSGVCTG